MKQITIPTTHVRKIGLLLSVMAIVLLGLASCSQGNKNQSNSATDSSPDAVKTSPATPSTAPPMDTERFYIDQNERDMNKISTSIRQHVTDRKMLRKYIMSTAFERTENKHIAFSSDAVIADIGSGVGAVSVQLLLEGRPFQKLYMVDIDDPTLQVARFIVDEYFPEVKSKVAMVKSTDDNVSLPEGVLDLALMNDVHFYIPKKDPKTENRPQSLACARSIYKAMKPGGTLRICQLIHRDAEQPEAQKEYLERIDHAQKWADELFREAGFTTVTVRANVEKAYYYFEYRR